jgi:hypothetical protein
LLGLNNPAITPDMRAIADAAKPKESPVGDASAKQYNDSILRELNVNPKTAQKAVPPEYQVNATDNDAQAKEKMQRAKDLVGGATGQQHISIDLGNQSKKGTAEDIKARQEIAKIYGDPMSSAERYNVMTDSLDKALKNHDQQAMLNLLTNHIGMTMGLQKGARITQAILQEAQKSQPWLASMKAKFDQDGYLSGVTLGPEQMHSMVDLARGRFSQDVVKARSLAKYAGAEDDGPERTPSLSTMHYYLDQAGNNVQKAKQLASEDGWSVK